MLEETVDVTRKDNNSKDNATNHCGNIFIVITENDTGTITAILCKCREAWGAMSLNLLAGGCGPNLSANKNILSYYFLTGSSAKPYNTEVLGRTTNRRQPKPSSLPTMWLQTPPAKPTPF